MGKTINARDAKLEGDAATIKALQAKYAGKTDAEIIAMLPVTRFIDEEVVGHARGRTGKASSPMKMSAALAKGKSFRAYLKRAIDLALQDAKMKCDDGSLKGICGQVKRGVRQNWANLRSEEFLEQFLWCVGSILKDYDLHLEYFPKQMKLFKQCDARSIVRSAKSIRAAFRNHKLYLSPRMFDAVMRVATSIDKDGWHAFKRQYLLLPENPESERTEDWLPAYSALDRLPMVGDAIAWFLIRNLYGAPFLKPDQHIKAIEGYFFGNGDLSEMPAAVRRIWPQVCTDPRIARVHLGVADYVLFWYSQKKGDPPN